MDSLKENTADALKVERFISLSTVARAFDCEPRTIEGSLRRYGIPLTELSSKKRGLLESDYRALIARSRQPAEAA